MPVGMDPFLAGLIIRKPIRAPVIKLSCGIGDSDGFPAFDSETSDNYAAPEDSKWGFNITGGAEFHMPLTVFQVSPRSLAAMEGIKLGDIILSINDIDASQMTLVKAREIIDSSYKIFIIFKSMEDEDVPPDQRKPGETKAISMRVPEPIKPPEPPKVKKSGIPQLQKPGSIQRTTIEEKLRSMHKKLSEIAEIPRILSSTLETVSQTFEKFAPPIETFSDCDAADDNDLDNDENLKDNDAILQQKNELNFKYHFQPIIDDTNSASEKESGTQDDLSNPDFEDIIHETDIINKHDDDIDDDDEDEFFEADSLDGDLQRKDVLNVPDSPESDYISEEDEEEVEQYSSPISGIVGKTTPTSILMKFNQIANNCMPELKTEEEQAEDEEGDEEDVASNSLNLSLKTVDDPVKTEKFEKVKLLERTWPWADRQKIIYRESTCHLVPRLSIVETRIKQLGGISTLPFHDRIRKDLNKSVDE